MSENDLVARFTFDNLVVGAGNRLSVAAARRVAESPGSSYNPLFIYSASGLGKTHLSHAIGHHARRVDAGLSLVYDTLEHFMGAMMAAIERGSREEFLAGIEGTGLLLLDDVQFLAGQHRMQEELLRTWDALSSRGGQVVLTSDRPPQEIDGLDDRLLSRFSGGLIVDIGAPDYETRVAIVRRRASEQGQTLGEGVAEALARTSFTNVRELQGGLNRILAVQDLEGRSVQAEEVDRLLGGASGAAGKRDSSGPARGEPTDFHDFMAEISSAVGEAVEESPGERQLTDAIMRWEAEGYRTRRLERHLAEPPGAEFLEETLRSFDADIDRLREISDEIRALDSEASELGRLDVLRDPDRVADAEDLLAGVRERCRPLPEPPVEYSFASPQLSPGAFSVRAAVAAAEEPGERYNPLFIYGSPGNGGTALLAALGRRILERDPDTRVAYLQGGAFAAGLIGALEANLAESWRARFRRARVLLLDDVDALARTERAQEELFHLVDALLRDGAQLAFTGSRPPAELTGLEERLRSRLASGLVVPFESEEDPEVSAAPDFAVNGAVAANVRSSGEAAAKPSSTDQPAMDEWFLDREKFLWFWPYASDWVLEED